MSDTVIVYIAGKEMARGQATSHGHVSYNQQTYLSVIDFYTEWVQRVCTSKDHHWWPLNKHHYNNCYISKKSQPTFR